MSSVSVPGVDLSLAALQGRINHSGGLIPFLVRLARIFSGDALFPKKDDKFFSRRYV